MTFELDHITIIGPDTYIKQGNTLRESRLQAYRVLYRKGYEFYVKETSYNLWIIIHISETDFHLIT